MKGEPVTVVCKDCQWAFIPERPHPNSPYPKRCPECYRVFRKNCYIKYRNKGWYHQFKSEPVTILCPDCEWPFIVNRLRGGGQYPVRCPVCETKYIRRRNKRWRISHPDNMKVMTKKRYLNGGKERNEAYRRKHPALIKSYRIRKTYGLSQEEYLYLLESQNGCCVICHSKLHAYTKDCHVDHDHETGKVRGLLCSDCNRGIGCLHEDPARIAMALNYILIFNNGGPSK